MFSIKDMAGMADNTVQLATSHPPMLSFFSSTPLDCAHPSALTQHKFFGDSKAGSGLTLQGSSSKGLIYEYAALRVIQFRGGVVGFGVGW